MSEPHVTCSRGFPAALRFVAEAGAAPALVLARLRYRVDAEKLTLESPPDEEAARRDERIALHDFETGPWPQTFERGQTMVRVADGIADPSRSMEVPAGIFSALYGTMAERLEPAARIAIPDAAQAAGYRVVRFADEEPWIYEGAQVMALRVVVFDLDPTQGGAYATFAAWVNAEPGSKLHISLDPPVGDEVTADVDSVKERLARNYPTGAMPVQSPLQATPFRPTGPPEGLPPQPKPSQIPPPPVAAPSGPSVVSPPLRSEIPVAAPPPVRGPDAARPLLDDGARGPVAPKPAPKEQPRYEAPAPQVALELLWHDGERVEAMNAASHLKAAPKSRPERRRVRRPRRGDEGEKKPELVVGELLRHSRPAVGSSLRTVLQEALASDDGSAEPMLMVEGQLHFTFDPRTELETLASLARPLAKAGGPLGEDLDHIDALLETPIEGAPDVARRMANKVRQSWKDANRSLPDDYLSSATERVLLTKRAYQKVQLFGASFLRTELDAGRRDRSTDRVVTYLPEEVATQLPLFTELAVRMIVTVHLRQDAAEQGPVALRCIALARSSDRP